MHAVPWVKASNAGHRVFYSPFASAAAGPPSRLVCVYAREPLCAGNCHSYSDNDLFGGVLKDILNMKSWAHKQVLSSGQVSTDR